MKHKLISLMLGMLMFFGCMSFNAEAKIQTDSFDIANSVLCQLGFISDKTLEKDNTVSRADFTSKLIKIMNLASSNATAPFSDIDETSGFYPTMAAAYSAGLINSTEARPEDKITYNEAVKMLVCMLGYDNYATQLGGYPTGYIRVANEINLTEGISLYDAPLAIRDEVCLIFNAINCDVMEITGIDDGVVYQKMEGITILERMHKIKRAEGLVEGVSTRKLYKNDVIDSGMVKIGGFAYAAEAENLSDYVGLNVNFYYTEDTKSVIALYCDEGSIVKLDTDDVYYSDDKIIYSVEDHKEKQLKLSSDVILLYNGFPSEEFNSALFTDDGGEVSFIDNDADGKVDCIFVEVTEDYVVKSVDTTLGIIYDLYTPGKFVSVSESLNDNVRFEDEYGNKMFPAEIFKYDVISVKKGLNNEAVYAIYSGREVYGTVEDLRIEDGKLYLTIDGKEYETIKSFADNEEIMTGDSGIFAMNILGKIATINRSFSDSDDVTLGYMIDAAKGEGLTDEYYYKILTADGDIVSFTSAEKLRIDAKSYTAAKAYDEITKTGEAVSQPVRYSLNDDGLLKMLDTTSLGSEESENSMNRMYSCFYDEYGTERRTVQELKWKSGNKIAGSKVATDSNTVVFKVPLTKTNNDEDYFVTNVSYFVGNEKIKMQAYRTMSDSLVADVITVNEFSRDSIDANGYGISVFVSKATVATEDGEVRTRLTLMEAGGENTYYLKDESVLSGVSLTDGGAVHSLSNGDVISVACNVKNEITSIKLIYDCVGGNFRYPGDNYDTAEPDADERVSLNEVYSMQDGYMLVAKGEINSAADYNYDNLECYPAYKYNVIMYNSALRDDNKVSSGMVSDIIDYKTAGKGSKIVLYTKSSTAGTIVIYK